MSNVGVVRSAGKGNMRVDSENILRIAQQLVAEYEASVSAEGPVGESYDEEAQLAARILTLLREKKIRAGNLPSQLTRSFPDILKGRKMGSRDLRALAGCIDEILRSGATAETALR